MTITDTHTHLYYPEFGDSLEVLLEKAGKKNVTRFFMPNVDSTSMQMMYDVNKKFPDNCFMMLGLHPCSVKENYKEELAIVERELNNKKFVAIGEIGIDLYWDKTFFEQQQDAFSTQIQWALEKQLPIDIHCRAAFDETYEIIQQYYGKGINHHPGIFHCFSGDIAQAEKVIALGFKLGIGGVVTYKNSGLDKVVDAVDIKHIVLETDSPYLAPVPFRGKTNLPEYIYNIAERVAFIKQMSLSELAEITTKNSVEVFGV